MSRISSTHERNQNVHKILIRKPEGNRTLARPKHEWEGVRCSGDDRRHKVGYPPGVGATSDSSVLIISSTLESDWRAITGCFAPDSPWESAGTF
jgi:hypothetical protein